MAIKSARRLASLGIGVVLLSMPILSSSVFAASSELVYGDHGAQVATLEQDLTKVGLYHGAIDGVFGPGVLAGVKEFQSDHGLQATGNAGAKTLSLLYGAVSPKSSTSASLLSVPQTDGYLYVGSKGAEVVILQQDLKSLGFFSGNATGTYGQETYKAVVAYQAHVGLPDQGYVGALTEAALKKSLAGSARPTAVVAPVAQPSRAASVVALALQYQGAPYVWGGNSPATGFDCSGFTQWVFSQFGVSLPRTTFTQWNAGTHVTLDQLTPGDLVFFTTEGVFANHVGIYIGNSQFISDTLPGQGVLVQSLNEAYWADSFDGGVSVLG